MSEQKTQAEDTDEPVIEKHGAYAGKELIGPFLSVEEALDRASTMNGLQFAVSHPNGDLIACRHRGKITIRRGHVQTGRGGSIDETGQWVDPKHSRIFLWRPV